MKNNIDQWINKFHYGNSLISYIGKTIMSLNNFTKLMKIELEKFEKNMKNLDMTEKTSQDWMQTFLNWIEWKTDEHSQHWEAK